jgi:aerobic-type carbon monoxide dehydrogenase small subunit (CoxS/CutS family)
MSVIPMVLNGKSVSAEVAGGIWLVQFLRECLRLTGTHVGATPVSAAFASSR